ncbi:MAG: ABC transporter permease [Deltaproteobacteria bacterium]|nr:ABC transporter permease [Deltaproteobacteria bacterium]
MTELDFVMILGGVVAGAAPIVLAAIGETITEKAGLINLSLDGSILLSAMAAFVVSYKTQSLVAGFAAGALTGAAVAAVIAVFSIYLRLSQVAVGFVLTLMARDLAYFLGNPYSRIHGPQVPPLPIPFLKDIPLIGPILFQHNITVYGSLLAIGLSGWYLYHTSMGLKLRSVGENPAASYARGIHPHHLQMIYTICGGLLVGLGGAVFSLSAKPGWGRPQGAEGTGWIALALVIFGGWNPVKAAAGAYLFALLQVMGIYFQGWFPSIPAQVFQTAPFPLMIFILVLMSFGQQESIKIRVDQRPWLKSALGFFSGSAPAALGKSFHQQ